MARVVVVGGGFCGVAAAKSCLSRGFKVVLIDAKGWFEFTPSILKVLAREQNAQRVKVPYREVLRRAQIVNGVVSRVSRSFVFVDGKKIRFDFLVVCPGAYVPVPKEGSVFVAKRLSDVLSLKKCLASASRVIVCGGGHVGIEASAELASLGKKVTLVHSAMRLIERTPAKAGAAAFKCLSGMGVDVRLDESVFGVNDGCVTTSKGSLRAGLVLWCIGIRPEIGFLRGSGLLSRDEKGADVLHVNGFLQAARPNVFAGGDAVDLRVEKTAQNAELQGAVIGENIWRLSMGMPLKRYRAVQTPMLVDLCRTGIFVWGNVVLEGLVFRWLKKAVEVRELFKLRYL